MGMTRGITGMTKDDYEWLGMTEDDKGWLRMIRDD